MADKESFEFIEDKIRSQAKGTEFGKDFEWLCKWYLENAPQYRGNFRKVYLWNEWPDRWGADCGIDLIAETYSGDLWAIQSKAVSEDHTLSKREIDSFLSESNRPEIKFRLLIASTDKVGKNASRTINQQEKPVSMLLRGDLLTTNLEWPHEIGGKAPKPARAKPRPHQKAAINDVKRGFKKHSKGQLIMACGTGKTLTGLWIKEALKAQRTLLLVPSISLVQQNLSEWGRHAKQDFECLVVCSDETVKNDAAVHHVSELGIDVTTDPADIATFLKKKHKRPVVVISTYHSSDRVSEGQLQAKRWFDLTICDEAHRLTGDINSTFATALHEDKIKSRKRLYMTATPRFLTERVKSHADQDGFELSSMDDPVTFGRVFHQLTFREAIESEPEPLLTDYQVVVIDVSTKEVQKLVLEGKPLRTNEGISTNGKKLGAQIGLSKAINKYGLKRLITFHSTVKGAKDFVDKDRDNSLPQIFKRLYKSKKIWARHISGLTSASKRRTIINELGAQPVNTTALISNCSCLNEGVDVPTLDGIAFIDPRSSMVDIIQAIGRVIRKSETKKIGTIVLPVFVNKEEDAETILEDSGFKHIYAVIRALKSHDGLLAERLDRLRQQLEESRDGDKDTTLSLPPNIHINFGLDIKGFSRKFIAHTIKMTTERTRLTEEQVFIWAKSHFDKHNSWPHKRSGTVEGTNEKWRNIDQSLKEGYRGFKGKSSLVDLIAKFSGHIPSHRKRKYTVKEIINEARDFHKKNKKWPNVRDGLVDRLGITWKGIDHGFRNGYRGLPKCKGLASVLEKHCGHKRRKKGKIPKTTHLSEEQIVHWIKAYYEKWGVYPTKRSGLIDNTDESWRNIDASLKSAGRGLARKSSLSRIIQDNFDYDPNKQKGMSGRHSPTHSHNL